MTLLDLCVLLKRKLWLVIGLPLACAVIAAAVVYFMPPEYSATATITASGEPAGVGAFATDEAAAFSTEGTEITASTNTSTRIITLKAEGGSADQAIHLVNKAANTAFLKAFDRYNPYTEREKITSLTLTLSVKFAESATDISPSVPKTAGIALLAGLFVAICIVVILDMVRGNIHSARDLEEDYEARLLGKLPKPGKQADTLSRNQLFANMRFASGEHKSVCVLPIDDEALAATACVELIEAGRQADRKMLLIDANMNGTSPLNGQLGEAGVEGPGLAGVLAEAAELNSAVRTVQGFDYLPAGRPTVSPSALLDTSKLSQTLEQAALEYDMVIVNVPASALHADFSYLTHAAGSTALCVQEFATKRKDIEAAAAQLSIADANVIGFIAAV